MDLSFRLTTSTAGLQHTLTSLAHYGFAENAAAAIVCTNEQNMEHGISRESKKPPSGGFLWSAKTLTRNNVFVFQLANDIHRLQGLVIDARR